MVDAVGLVPGFFGFRRGYWAPRFKTGLERELATRGHRGVRVHAFTTSPIGSLATRQKKLRGRLAEHGNDVRWHLVGHSTGGLDAALLMARRELELKARVGSVFSTSALTTTNVGTVVTLAAPMYGTGLAMQANIGHVARVCFDAMFHPDGALWSRLAFARAGMAAGVSLRKLVWQDDLARDLRTDRAGALVEEARIDNKHVYSIATCAPRPEDNHEDPLFRDLWQLTAKGDDATTLPEQTPGTRIGREVSIGPGANDGVVNTRRQVIGKLAAIVAGDHADVIGHYRRKGPPGDAGLLMSDARFGDAELDQLVACIAECLANGMRD